EVVEDLQRTGVDARRPAVRIDRRAFVDDADPCAVPRQLAGHGEPGGAGADDDDRVRAHHITAPPSMLTDWPVMNAAAGEHRNAIRPATSSSDAARPIGMRSSCCCQRSDRPRTSMRAVSIVPGHTALTVTPWRATSMASDCVRPWMPKLAAL